MNDWDSMIGELGAIPDLPGARCVGSHELYDAAIVAEHNAEDNRDYARAAALELCSRCPALAACREWVQSLPPPDRPIGVVAGQTFTRQPNREEPTMTESALLPSHRDRARVLRVVLAMLAGDLTDVVHVASEAENAADVRRFYAAGVDCFAAVLRRRHESPAEQVDRWIITELGLEDPEPNDYESIVPTHTDRARALSAVLSTLKSDWPGVADRFAEATTPRSVDRLLLAVCDCMHGFMAAVLENPVGYLESWIALELELATDEEGDADE